MPTRQEAERALDSIMVTAPTLAAEAARVKRYRDDQRLIKSARTVCRDALTLDGFTTPERALLAQIAANVDVTDDARTMHVRFRASREEMDVIEAQAEAEGFPSVSAYLRFKVQGVKD